MREPISGMACSLRQTFVGPVGERVADRGELDVRVGREGVDHRALAAAAAADETQLERFGAVAVAMHAPRHSECADGGQGGRLRQKRRRVVSVLIESSGICWFLAVEDGCWITPQHARVAAATRPC